MSNILYREFRSIFLWLWTYIPYRVVRKGPILNRIVRRAHRSSFRKNRVWAALFTWLRGTRVD